MARPHRGSHLPCCDETRAQTSFNHWRFYRLSAGTSSKPHPRDPHYAAISNLRSGARFLPSADIFTGYALVAEMRCDCHLQWSLTARCKIDSETNDLLIAEPSSEAALSLVELHSQVSGYCTAPKSKRKEKEAEVGPPEDLMREHGVLKRVLLIYGEVLRRIDAKQDFPPEALAEAAGIIRSFVEDYPEKLEEDFLFPRFEQANLVVDLVKEIGRA